MCLILFAYKFHPEYPLVLIANRDEFFQRETRHAQWWPEAPQLLAGKDLEAGGTWMGLTRAGRFAAITNVRGGIEQPTARSRGLLTYDYLASDMNARSFAARLKKSSKSYQGYNLIYGRIDQLHYFTNQGRAATALQPGIYGLSNASLDTAWPKVEIGKQALQAELGTKQLVSDRLLKILEATATADDAELPSTGVSLEWERRLSAICITGRDYGTRSSTALLVDRNGNTRFHEKTVAPVISQDRIFKFVLEQ